MVGSIVPPPSSVSGFVFSCAQLLFPFTAVRSFTESLLMLHFLLRLSKRSHQHTAAGFDPNVALVELLNIVNKIKDTDLFESAGWDVKQKLMLSQCWGFKSSCWWSVVWISGSDLLKLYLMSQSDDSNPQISDGYALGGLFRRSERSDDWALNTHTQKHTHFKYFPSQQLNISQALYRNIDWITVKNFYRSASTSFSHPSLNIYRCFVDDFFFLGGGQFKLSPKFFLYWFKLVWLFTFEYFPTAQTKVFV